MILAFHAHELLWDLPGTLLSSLDDRNPMKDTVLDENYMKKRKEQQRDIYTRSIKFAKSLKAPLCVEYTNELLFQIQQLMPGAFQRLKKSYKSRRLYPLYGHAHHTHISLLKVEEIIQEIRWNREYLHGFMDVPYPRYNGLFSPEASYDYSKLISLERANIHYIIFPHLNEEKAPFSLKDRGDYQYKPFMVKTERKNILAFPRNFPISQEIWRPITKMKREEVKFQGYLLGHYPVFYNEYLHHEVEAFPINLEEGVELYKGVLLAELEKSPPDGVLVHIQDLELMDFGDLALEIMEKAWKQALEETRGKYKIYFVTPDEYIDGVLKVHGLEKLPEVNFQKICWAPEIRLVLRVDGHYPPLGVKGVNGYERDKTGLYEYPHIFWENGKYFCGIFNTLAANFNLAATPAVTAAHFNNTGYDLLQLEPDTRAVMCLILMKRACNWGWRPTEGRQKLPYLKGFFFCCTLLQKLEEYPAELFLSRQLRNLEERDIVGIARTLDIFIDGRVNYLKYGMERLAAEKGEDLTPAYSEVEEVFRWKEIAVNKTIELYEVNKAGISGADNVKTVLMLLRDYCQAVFMSTEHLQRLWGKLKDTEFMVENMYEYLYKLYPPLFPPLVREIDAMDPQQIEEFFAALKKAVPAV